MAAAAMAMRARTWLSKSAWPSPAAAEGVEPPAAAEAEVEVEAKADGAA